MLKNKNLDVKTPDGINQLGQIAFTFRTWIDVLENQLHMEDVPKIEKFSE